LAVAPRFLLARLAPPRAAWTPAPPGGALPTAARRRRRPARQAAQASRRVDGPGPGPVRIQASVPGSLLARTPPERGPVPLRVPVRRGGPPLLAGQVLVQDGADRGKRAPERSVPPAWCRRTAARTPPCRARIARRSPSAQIRDTCALNPERDQPSSAESEHREGRRAGATSTFLRAGQAAGGGLGITSPADPELHGTRRRLRACRDAVRVRWCRPPPGTGRLHRNVGNP
jgi:hypothetical protein